MPPHSAAQSRALDYHWSVPDRLHDLPGLATLGKTPYRKARASILASALIAHGTEQPVVSYSRRRRWYVGRFELTSFSHGTVVAAVDEAVSAGLLGHLKAKPGDHLTTGLQSVFWAEDALVDALGDVTLEYERGSVIRLRDAEGNPVAFRETERVSRLRREMDGINAYMSQISVGISDQADPGDWDVGRNRIRARKIKDGKTTWATVCPTPGNDVYRVFGRGRFDKGGRLYGWWQNLPKIRRSELLINGEASFEPDFEFMHPRMLYAMCGAVLVGDPYVTGVFPRDHGKLALNVALNAKSLPLAINAMMYRNVESPGAWPHSRSYTERLVNAVVARNAPIADDIGADRGIDMMHIDSGITVRVLKACEKAGVAVLPIHDSFRVGASKEGQVTAIMQEVLDLTLVAISSSSSKGSNKMVPHMRPPLPAEPVVASLPEGREDLSSPVVASAAEPVFAPSLEGAGNTLSRLATPRPEARGSLLAGGVVSSPEGSGDPLPEGLVSPAPVLAAPDPQASFRPVTALRRPALRPVSLRPVVTAAPLSPPPLAPPAPVPSAAPSTRPPLPPFLQAAREELRAEAEAAAVAAAAAALVRESAPPPAPVRRVWAPLPPRKDSPAPVLVEALVAPPVPSPQPVRRTLVQMAPVDEFATLRLSAPVPSLTSQRPMTREEVSTSLKACAEKARLRMEARERERKRTAYR